MNFYRAPVAVSVVIFCFVFELGCSSPEKDYRRAQAENTEAAYKSFLSRHPQDPLAAKAAAQLSQLAFKRADQTGTEAAFIEFLSLYPKDSLAAQASARLEEIVFSQARKTRTEAAWTGFLKRFPNSTLTSKAQLELVSVGDDYRSKVKKWGRQNLYPGWSEERVYAVVKKRQMHYLYVAFLELFPQSSHRPEIEQLLSQFSLETFPKNTVLTYKEMAQRFNFDANHVFYRWNGTLVVTLAGGSMYIMAPDSFYTPESGAYGKDGNGPETTGSFCYGNLQILNGSVIGRGPAKEFTKGTSLIYPAARR